MNGSLVSLDSFVKAFDSILESLESDNAKRKKSRVEDQKKINLLYRLIVNSRQNVLQNGDGKLMELIESLLNEWEESAPPSNAVQQLVSLLSKSLTKTIFSTYDKIVERCYSPELPEVPYEVDDDDGVAVKIVRLVKADEPLGATIKCDSNGTVLIARIIADGVADRSECIQVGDRVLEVNGVAVTGMKPTEVVKLLNSDNGSVTFKLIPAEVSVTYENIEKRFVRALVDYNANKDTMHPCPEAALSFGRGEILQIIVTDDEHWWQAKPLGYGAFASASRSTQELERLKRVGLIPSESLYQKLRSQEGDTNSPSNCSQSLAFMYENVDRFMPNSAVLRPIVLIGAHGVGRNELRKRLILKNCVKYATTVPHTSRPPRPHEIEAVDYYFARRDEMEQWIKKARFLEFGEYRGNLYGTLIESVSVVIKQGRIPVLNPHHHALHILRNGIFKPYVIFVRPPPLEVLKETRMCQKFNSGLSIGNRAPNSNSTFPRTFTDAELERMITASDRLWQHYGQFCDSTIVNDNLEVAFEQLYQLAQRIEDEPSWVPSEWLT